MSNDSAIFKAEFVRFTQVRDCGHFVFSVPAEQAAEFLSRIGGLPAPGESRWFAIAQLRESDKAENPSDDTSTEEKTNTLVRDEPASKEQKRLFFLAGTLPRNPRFRKFIETPSDAPDPEAYAISYIKLVCDVDLRRKILVGTKAAGMLEGLYADFLAWDTAPRAGA